MHTAPTQQYGEEQRLCIFVVDDNKDAADSLSELLNFLGHECHAFHDPFVALEAARRARPCAVVSDIGMPGMTGYDLARELRECTPATLLVACSGWGAAADRAAAASAGFKHHLVKPAGIADLQDIFAALPPRSSDAPPCQVGL
jgi:CheY-like chemotaxis protein